MTLSFHALPVAHPFSLQIPLQVSLAKVHVQLLEDDRLEGFVIYLRCTACLEIPELGSDDCKDVACSAPASPILVEDASSSACN